MGHAGGDCLRLNAFDLADAIEEHAEWLRELADDISQAQKLARAGRLRRPSLEEWQAANDD